MEILVVVGRHTKTIATSYVETPREDFSFVALNWTLMLAKISLES